MRGFEIISKKEFIKNRPEIEYENIILPKRGTKLSAGYDFSIPYDVTILPHQSLVIATGIKAYMQENEVLLLVIRSSLGIKYGIRLKNQVGVIDCDYYNNVKNEGHIFLAIENTNNETVEIHRGDRVVQGLFIKYLIASNEEKIENERVGGIGSTRK